MVKTFQPAKCGRMPWVLEELAMCLLEFRGIKTGTWLSGVLKAGDQLKQGKWGEGN